MKTPTAKMLRFAVEAVNRRLYLQQKDDASLSGMGTTLTLLWAASKEVYIAQVGDSRAYLLRDGDFQQITQDHSLVQELVNQGVLTPSWPPTTPCATLLPAPWAPTRA